MCGRYYLATASSELARQFQVQIPWELPPRYNVAPSQPVLGFRLVRGNREAAVFQWGLVPAWSKEPAMGSRLINARAETVAEKPSFRSAFRARRCLIPADGFYEWKASGGRKQPYRVGLASGEPFAMAGIWEQWEGVEGFLETCAIITTEPNELTATIHNRMPVILDSVNAERWLLAPAVDLLRPYPAEEMSAWPISSRVNSAANDDPSVLVEEATLGL